MKITQRNVDSLTLPPGKGEIICFDDALPGFGIRLRAGGTKTFIANYKIGAKQRRITLGATALLKAEAARAAATELLAKVKLGGDPAAARDTARLRAGETFAAVAERYLAHRAIRLRPSTYAATARYLTDHFKPLRDLALTQIDRRAVASALSEIATSRGPAAADCGRATLSGFFTWAAKEGLIDSNPAVYTNLHHHAKARERVLTNAELVAVWHGAGDGTYGVLVKLLILTACRRAEIGSLRWDEIDFAARVLHLPGERTKNHRSHLVPLSDPALQLLQAMPRVGPFVFGTSVIGYCKWASAKRALDTRIAAPMPAWVIHDLRRSAATHMANLGVQPHVIEALLNHVSGHKAGVAGIYNLATYDQERRIALNLWAERIAALVSGRVSNVVVLARA